jgi:secreted trypsin-like serine protease
VHPQYNENSLQNDIAVITLPAVSNKPALALPQSDLFKYLAENTSTKNVQVVGHGDTISDTNSSTFAASATLLDVDLTPRTAQECLNSNIGGGFDAATMVCAGDPGFDSCQGDSGGPLIDPTTDTLLGVVSWGPTQCGINSTNAYGAYTNVFSFVEWIETGEWSANLGGDTTVKANGDVVRLGAGAIPVLWLFGVMGVLLVSRKRS